MLCSKPPIYSICVRIDRSQAPIISRYGEQREPSPRTRRSHLVIWRQFIGKKPFGFLNDLRFLPLSMRKTNLARIKVNNGSGSGNPPISYRVRRNQTTSFARAKTAQWGHHLPTKLEPSHSMPPAMERATGPGFLLCRGHFSGSRFRYVLVLLTHEGCNLSG
jgi:hypothetical protein